MTHAAMAEADIALPGLEDAILLTGKSDPDAIVNFYLALGAGIVALTLGAEGSLIATATERRRFSGHTIDAKDATGVAIHSTAAFLQNISAPAIRLPQGVMPIWPPLSQRKDSGLSIPCRDDRRWRRH